MIPHAGSANFLLESAQPFGITEESWRKNLDSNLASESGVLRAIHFTPPARADWSDDFMASQVCANG